MSLQDRPVVSRSAGLPTVLRRWPGALGIGRLGAQGGPKLDDYIAFGAQGTSRMRSQWLREQLGDGLRWRRVEGPDPSTGAEARGEGGKAAICEHFVVYLPFLIPQPQSFVVTVGGRLCGHRNAA